MICLGIESTAHTFAVGIVEDENTGIKILADVRRMYLPKTGQGIHPNEAREHHRAVKDEVLHEALEKAHCSLDDIDVIAYAKGPGLPPSLQVGLEFTKQLAAQTNKPVIEVNHPIGHIEIGKVLCGAGNPLVLFVSGGNTQVIAYTHGRYRIVGETQDVAIGNAIDMLMRSLGHGYPGGPIFEQLVATGKNYIELPYSVKGMDVSLSGIVTEAIKKTKKHKPEDVCFSFGETAFAMLTEITERALAHTGKKELLITGGVAASKRLCTMLEIMCQERGAIFYHCPKAYTGDNGVMIAWSGLLAFQHGQHPVAQDAIDFQQRWRLDDVPVCWIEESCEVE
ncbi:MAG: tRNA (adenosine(37)-N6)-threonylcarbamoyltransferase complex transferase subunit TsaD [Candidatus Aenigmarchaeota archaeon]|nr:tRNA (adenosine(37)-N6)-threonylcarbamoyltransferase complex transferase subunit TsaD [Candidatus Aenigmarchaeota archaeon]